MRSQQLREKSGEYSPVSSGTFVDREGKSTRQYVCNVNPAGVKGKNVWNPTPRVASRVARD
ncbi:MAG: hypothetical protein WB930_05440 [Syntrophobacteraceae bacterium]